LRVEGGELRVEGYLEFGTWNMESKGVDVKSLTFNIHREEGAKFLIPRDVTKFSSSRSQKKRPANCRSHKC